MLRARIEDASSQVQVIDIDMMLPSQVLTRITCDKKLIDYEWKLRYAQAAEALHELQQSLLVRRQLYKSKEQYGTGQRHHTRSVTLIKTVQTKVDRAVDRYRLTRTRLTSLATVVTVKNRGWENTMRPTVALGDQVKISMPL